MAEKAGFNTERETLCWQQNGSIRENDDDALFFPINFIENSHFRRACTTTVSAVNLLACFDGKMMAIFHFMRFLICCCCRY